MMCGRTTNRVRPVLAATRICPLTVTKKARQPSQTVSGFPVSALLVPHISIRALGKGVGSEGDRMQIRALCITIIRSGAETCSGVVHRRLESPLSWQPVTVAR